MSIYTLEKTQQLQISLDKAWKFFSDPKNLKIITPPELGLTIISGTSGTKEEIYPGMIIIYELNIVPFFKSRWLTEISHVNAPYFFVDEQRIGPYSFWHHKHYFKESDNGVLVSDIVHYSLPLGPAGQILNKFIIRNRLEHIFNYRERVLERLFSSRI